MSDLVTVSHEGMASVVTMNNPPMNLMDIETMDALLAAHQEADAHPDTRVIVTRSAIEGMFSNGLNPMYVLERDAAGRLDVFTGVGRLVTGIYSLTKPHITVVNGPAMAGGAVLAILSDFRYFDQDHGRISFAEGKVGVPIPEGLIAIIRDVCQPTMLRDVVLMGKNLDAEEAKAAGLADGIAPSEQLDAIVDKQVERIARLSLDVLRVTKANLRAPVLARTQNVLQDSGGGHEFAKFVGEAYLGEGLKAVIEARPPVYVR